jgi:hypothetical protein
VTIEVQPTTGDTFTVPATITLCRSEGTAGFRVGAEFTGIPADVERQLILMLYQGLAPGTVHRLDNPGELELAAA